MQGRDGHREGCRLALADGAVGDPGDEEGDLLVGQLAAVALGPDDLLGQHAQAPAPASAGSPANDPTKARTRRARSAAAIAAPRSVCWWSIGSWLIPDGPS